MMRYCSERIERMTKVLLAVLLPLALGGCISLHDNPTPKSTTIVVPPGSTVTCSNGMPGPC
jgi:hypothetical protein